MRYPIKDYDNSYKNWILGISKRFRKSQIRASVRVNDTMLRFYWTLGKDIAEMHMESKYGNGFYQTLSKDLRTLLPEVHSFSVTNLKYMKRFFRDVSTNTKQSTSC